ncbi:putative DNA methylase [Rubrobacter radiotolerans DSM 5868]|nr:putative DNA methylase [Rubrobacter radiotolerans DSM 5868]
MQQPLWSDDVAAKVVAGRSATKTGKRLIEDGFPVGEISLVAEAESWRKEIHRPIYHVHKWWARRLGSVFRAIILGAALEEGEDFFGRFYSPTKLEGLTVFDPFMGSGTTIGEAVKLGCNAIGRDINPVAYNAVRAALGPYTKEDLESTMGWLDSRVGEELRGLYRAVDSEGRECDVLYHFWVKVVLCQACGAEVRLFPSYVFARHAYPSRQPTARVVCPSCWGISDARYDCIDHECPHCRERFDPQDGPAKRSKAECQHCGHEFPILEAVRRSEGPPDHALYAKLVLRQDGTKAYERITEQDLESYRRCGERLRELPHDWPPGELKAGYNTKQAMSYGYTAWRHFFNDRQRLALTILAGAIREIEDPDLRFAFAILFSGTLEFNNMFASYKGEGTGAVRHMFAHHILKPERTPIEANVWGTPKSSGSFTTLFRSRLLRALEYRESPHEIRVDEQTGRPQKVRGLSEPLLDNVKIADSFEDVASGAVYLSCGDSANTDIPPRSVDLVVTDPPFFDNVHYSELADFFHAWQRVLLPDETGYASSATTRSPREVQDGEKDSFARKLRDVFAECERVLKPEGLLAFTYHHSRDDGWEAVAEAVAGAGFSFVAAQPIKSEMSVAAPKSQARDPIDIDVVLVCRKSCFDQRPTLGVDDALGTALGIAKEKVGQFSRKRTPLSGADERVIRLSQLLVALSAGRRAEDLVGALRAARSAHWTE